MKITKNEQKKVIHPTICSLRTCYNRQRCSSLNAQTHTPVKVSPLKLGISFLISVISGEKNKQRESNKAMPPPSLCPKRAEQTEWDQVRKRRTRLGQTQRDSEWAALGLLSGEISSCCLHIERSNASAIACSAQQQKYLCKNTTKQGTAGLLVVCLLLKNTFYLLQHSKKKPQRNTNAYSSSYKLWYSAVSDSPFSRGRDVRTHFQRATRC